MHELHRRAAEEHEQAAQAHRTAAEHLEKGDRETAQWHAGRALRYSNDAIKLAEEAQPKAKQMVNF